MESRYLAPEILRYTDFSTLLCQPNNFTSECDLCITSYFWYSFKQTVRSLVQNNKALGFNLWHKDFVDSTMLWYTSSKLFWVLWTLSNSSGDTKETPHLVQSLSTVNWSSRCNNIQNVLKNAYIWIRIWIIIFVSNTMQ